MGASESAPRDDVLDILLPGGRPPQFFQTYAPAAEDPDAGKPPPQAACRFCGERGDAEKLALSGPWHRPECQRFSPPSHMTPCVCHCAACRAAGHGNGACVDLCVGLHRLLDGKADVVEQILRNCHGDSCGWGTASFDAELRCVRYGPGGDVIAAGDSAGRMHLICAHTGEKILCLTTLEATTIEHLEFSSDGSKIAATCNDHRNDKFAVKILDAATGAVLRALPFDKCASGLSYAARGDMLAVGDSGGNIHVLDAQGENTLPPIKVDGGLRVSRVAFSPDDAMLAAGVGESPCNIRILDTRSGEQLREMAGHSSSITGLCFDCSGKTIASSSIDHTVRLWDAVTGAAIHTLKHGPSVTDVAFKPGDPNILVSSGGNQKVKVWDLSTFTCLATFRHARQVGGVAFHPTKDIVASCSYDKTIKVWNTRNPEPSGQPSVMPLTDRIWAELEEEGRD